MNILIFILRYIFPIMNIIVGLFVLSQAIRYLKNFGFLPYMLIIGTVCSSTIAILCLLVLLGLINTVTFFILFQSPFLILLAAPGIVSRQSLIDRLRGASK